MSEFENNFSALFVIFYKILTLKVSLVCQLNNFVHASLKQIELVSHVTEEHLKEQVNIA